jgi:hypothetical protein
MFKEEIIFCIQCSRALDLQTNVRGDTLRVTSANKIQSPKFKITTSLKHSSLFIYFYITNVVYLSRSTIFHALRPSRAPGFAYAWLELISHRMFMSKLLLNTPQQKV